MWRLRKQQLLLLQPLLQLRMRPVLLLLLLLLLQRPRVRWLELRLLRGQM